MHSGTVHGVCAFQLCRYARQTCVTAAGIADATQDICISFCKLWQQVDQAACMCSHCMIRAVSVLACFKLSLNSQQHQAKTHINVRFQLRRHNTGPPIASRCVSRPMSFESLLC